MEHLPEWARAFNASGRIAQAAREANVEGTTQFYELVGRTPAANRYELDFAKALITAKSSARTASPTWWWFRFRPTTFRAISSVPTRTPRSR
jgi:predicted GNAT superfamily acetyltransferase